MIPWAALLDPNQIFSPLQHSKICPGFQLVFKASAPTVRYKDNGNLCSGNKPVILPFIITEALYKLMEKYLLWLHISKCKWAWKGINQPCQIYEHKCSSSDDEVALQV